VDEFRLPLPFPAIILFCLPVLCLCAVCLALASWVTLTICIGATTVLVITSWCLHWHRIIRSAKIYNKLATEAPLEECPQVTASLEATGAVIDPEGGSASGTSPSPPPVSPGSTETGPIILEATEGGDGADDGGDDDGKSALIRARTSIHLDSGSGFAPDEEQGEGRPSSPPMLVLRRSSAATAVQPSDPVPPAAAPSSTVPQVDPAEQSHTQPPNEAEVIKFGTTARQQV
jgi:hypothetical protein